MAKRMTVNQLRQDYPNQYVALRNPVYVHGILESAEAAYTEQSAMILFWRQIMEPDILIWYSGCNPPMFMDMMFLF